MNVENNEVLFLKQETGNIEGITTHIERVGNICGKKGNGDSYCNWLVESGYESILKHGAVYLRIPTEHVNNGMAYVDVFMDNEPYSTWDIILDEFLVSTNYYVLVKHELTDLLEYICDPTYIHRKLYTFVIKAPISSIIEISQFCGMVNNFSDEQIVLTGSNKEWMGFLPKLNKILGRKDISDLIDQKIEEEG